MKMLTIACMLLALAVTGCVSRTESAATRLRNDIAMSKPAPVVKGDKALVIVDERLHARAMLLATAVAALAVVSLCLAAGTYFPLIASFLHIVAASAGGFALVVMALRSLVAVPDWAILCVLGAAVAVASARLLLHGASLSAALHEVVAKAKPEAGVLSTKARALVQRVATKLKGPA